MEIFQGLHFSKNELRKNCQKKCLDLVLLYSGRARHEVNTIVQGPKHVLATVIPALKIFNKYPVIKVNLNFNNSGSRRCLVEVRDV